MRRKDDEKENSIKEAVIKLILQEGFHGTSISKIAKVAGVSPATVYIYYENKEAMLRDIYEEYAEDIFTHVLERVQREMNGRQLIEMLVYSYYSYIRDHEEIFNFVDQFSSCPSLASGCAGIKAMQEMNRFILELKEAGVIKNYSNENLFAFIFYPVKAIAVDRQKSEREKDILLQEMIEMIQSALLRV